MDSDDSALSWVLGESTRRKVFLRDFWQKAPMKGSRGAEDGSADYFSVEKLLELSESQKLVYEVDLNVVSCKDGLRKQVVHEPGKVATKAELLEFLKTETVQFFQPQRFIDGLWHRMAALESEFGTLWGSNVYITAPNTQGLAPHFDDVEIFVLQISGRKRWFVHEPGEPFQENALEYSEDLDQLGEKIMEVVLRPGDLLYLPRGTTHFAKSEGDEHSVHVTLSTHQHSSYFDLLETSFPQMLRAATSERKEFRSGLPVGYLFENRTLGQARKRRSGSSTVLKENLAKMLRTIADDLMKDEAHLKGSVAEAFHEGVDAFGIDFFLGRLPQKKPGLDHVCKLDMKKIPSHFQISLTNPRLIHTCLLDESDIDDGSEMDDDNSLEAGPIVRVFSSEKNSRRTHMGPRQEGAEPPYVDFPASAKADLVLGSLLEAFPAPKTIADLACFETQHFTAIIKSFEAFGIITVSTTD